MTTTNEATYHVTVPGIGTYAIPADSIAQARTRTAEFLADGGDSDVGEIHVDARFLVVALAA